MQHRLDINDYKKSLKDAALSDSPINRLVLVRVFQEPNPSLADITNYHSSGTLKEKHDNDSCVPLKHNCEYNKLQ